MSQRVLLTVAVAVCALVYPAAGAGEYDPCAGQSAASKDDGFALGVAYYPGGADADWAGLHPCKYPDRATLAAKGVGTMVFRPAVDKMSFFRGRGARASTTSSPTAAAPGCSPRVVTGREIPFFFSGDIFKFKPPGWDGMA